MAYADRLVVVTGGRLVLLAVDCPPFSLSEYADEVRKLLGALSVSSFLSWRLHHGITAQFCCTHSPSPMPELPAGQ